MKNFKKDLNQTTDIAIINKIQKIKNFIEEKNNQKIELTYEEKLKIKNEEHKVERYIINNKMFFTRLNPNDEVAFRFNLNYINYILN